MFSERVIAFNRQLSFGGVLPDGIHILNPFRDAQTLEMSSQFYRKFYADEAPRTLILGINPGRHGAGVTGVPFTDAHRLADPCGIIYPHGITYETSSVFIYEMIRAFGGPELFYRKFYINSVCPLGFTQTGKNGKEVNYNYYDSKELTNAVYDFIISNIRKQIELGINIEVCYCLGTGKNERFLTELNSKHHFFGEIIALEHPRFIMQYRSKSRQLYVEKYLSALGAV